ncbi:hypothetical protein HUU05_02260 [candidate division KSB1 bacterium]|nr:hypothetical protein [candidate division KSB1 bacterium]
MNTKLASQSYLIQIDLAKAAEKKKARVNIDTLKRLLGGTGIELDPSYSPVCINPQQHRFVVRGEATSEARRRAEQRFGTDVKFFSDGRVQPITANGKKREAAD